MAIGALGQGCSRVWRWRQAQPVAEGAGEAPDRNLMLDPASGDAVAPQDDRNMGV